MLQKEDVLKTAKRRLKCKHEWQKLQGAMKCPNCGAIFLTKPDGAIFLGTKGEKRK
jgi:Zn finger protein HypA/HybF involved in hydrogenase expression